MDTYKFILNLMTITFTITLAIFITCTVKELEHIRIEVQHTNENTIKTQQETLHHIETIMSMGKRLELLKHQEKRVFLDGIYSTNEYYCVWTQGRNQTEIIDKDNNLNAIQKTALHEYCHHLVNENKKHYCTNQEDLQWT